jgi:predicted kinase
MAGEVSAQLVQLRLTASEDLARRQMTTRQQGVSDADIQIARHMAAATPNKGGFDALCAAGVRRTAAADAMAGS